MNYRIVSSIYPARVLQHVQACGCMSRTETTNYRGLIAFIGDGRVWAVAELCDVKPVGSRAKGEIVDAGGFLWCFKELHEVEAIPCANYLAPAMFDNQGQWEPLFLQASAQVALNRLFSPKSGLESLEMPSGVSVPTEAPETRELANCGASGGQMELF